MAKTLYAPGAKKSRATALAKVGTKFPAGWCLYWCLKEVFFVPGLGDYDHDGAADAEDYWKAAVARGKAVKTGVASSIPPGVIIMWTGGRNDHGHAAYSLGNGEMVSTDLPRSGFIGRVKITEAKRVWGLKLVGYVLVDGNGFTLVQPDTTPPPAPKPNVYEVTAKIGLNVRTGPSLRAEVVRVAKLGTKVTEVKTVEATNGRHFVVDKAGHYFAKQYLKKV